MKKVILFLVILCFIQNVSSQISDIIPSSITIAQASVSDTRNWTAFNNPAMLGYLKRSEFGFQFENRYLIPELSTKSLQIGYASTLVNVGASFSHYGYSLYNEMLIGIDFARNFSDKFALGVQFSYYLAYFSASNSYRTALLPQIGLSTKLFPGFSIGFCTFNPFQTNIKTEFTLKRIPSVFSFGSEYSFSPEFVFFTQIDKEISSNYRFATGFEYQMRESISVKLGACYTDYLIPCIGLGLNTNSFLFHLNCELHPLLGLNTIAGIKYLFGK